MSSELFKATDFQSLKVELALVNRTSAGTRENHVELIEVDDADRIDLDVPPHTGAVGNEVELCVKASRGGQTFDFIVIGKIIENNATSEGRFKMALRIEPHPDWSSFVSYFATRQEEINQLLAAYKS